MGIDGVFVSAVAIAPHLVEELAAFEDPSRWRAKWCSRSNSLAVSSTGFHRSWPSGLDVEAQAIALDHRRRGILGFSQVVDAAEERFDPRRKFENAERFGEVVVGAHLQTEDAIDFRRFGGQHQDRQVLPFFARRSRQMASPSVPGSIRSRTTRSNSRPRARFRPSLRHGWGDRATELDKLHLHQSRDVSVILDHQYLASCHGSSLPSFRTIHPS